MSSETNNVSNGNDDIQPSSFKFFDFPLQVGETRFACEIMRMQDSLYVWIGDENEKKINDLSVAFKSNYESVPIATKIMGPTGDSTSSNLAKRLTKKCGMPVYVSFNIVAENFTLLGIEKSLSIELKERSYILEL